MNRTLRCALLIGILAYGFQFMQAQAQIAQADLRVIPDSPEMHQMLPAYLNRRAQEATEKRLARFHQIQTEIDFRNWQEANRRTFLDLIGGLPTERSPLHARVTGEIPREGYIIRKVIFESLPEY